MIKRLIENSVNSEQIDRATLVLRIIAGGFMLTHGIGKLQKLLSGNMDFINPIGIGEPVTLVLAVFAEFLCAVFILIGFKTRLASLPLIATMLVAAFVVHGSDPLGDKELALIYLGMYLSLFLLGSGKYSVDGLLKKD